MGLLIIIFTILSIVVSPFIKRKWFIRLRRFVFFFNLIAPVFFWKANDTDGEFVALFLGVVAAVFMSFTMTAVRFGTQQGRSTLEPILNDFGLIKWLNIFDEE